MSTSTLVIKQPGVDIFVPDLAEWRRKVGRVGDDMRAAVMKLTMSKHRH